MITKDQAIKSNEFHRGECYKIRGQKRRVEICSTIVRRAGQTKTWKRSTEKFRVPVKHGLNTWFWITEVNCEDWHILEDCPLQQAYNMSYDLDDFLLIQDDKVLAVSGNTEDFDSIKNVLNKNKNWIVVKVVEKSEEESPTLELI